MPIVTKSQAAIYLDLFEQAPVAYHEIDTNGIITRVNRTECKLLGYNSTEMLGQPAWAFLHPDDRSASPERIREKMRMPYPIPPSERRFLRKDGSVLTLEINENHILDIEERVIGIRSTMLDITDRKRAEQAEENLRRLEEKYRQFFEENAAANFISTPEGNLLACNSAFLELFGFGSLEEALATPTTSLFRHPGDRQALLERLREARQLRNHQVEYRRRDGGRVYAIANISGAFGYRGELTELRGNLIDDTDRRMKAEALARKTEELARSNAELEQFAYVASHDLQEPLRMVASYTQLLARRYRGRLDRDADDFIEFAVDGARRMQNLINDLLAYSRVTTRAGQRQPISAQTALAAARKNLTAAVEESHATIHCGALPTVVADPTQLMQVFQNLLGNAIKYRSSVPPEISVTGEEHPAEWHFSVRDNGIGIDPRHSERIFQVFQRLHNEKDYPGTGIGLAVCKKIVERHRGRIWVESEPGQGSTFHFTISKNGDS